MDWPRRTATGLRLVLGLLVMGPASAQIYRWTAPDGSTVMGDRPPPGVNATLVSGKKEAQAAPVDAAKAREQQLQRQDDWQATIRRRSEAASTAAPSARSGPAPRPQGTPTAPQGDCARYRELLDLARNGQLKGCQGSRCWKAESGEVEMLEREGREACARR
ncbi:hypothetical protein HNQ51_000825 [Inhella inkyongensis]|uniref:DUF4124 domain-containing protein n=1 Tax=Inhella inkyongensis TaxID=392593 RepID=A0A840S1Y0_9BURK|nr:DUF4124 domain-containing protein [Inhella inkyongensis]MBB5203532.1 hypothetical protein [Inhella inkyongensis]